eukprot:365673-Pleurochrysis_carterae.AAC.1
MVCGLPAASARAAVTLPTPSIAISNARTNSAGGMASAPAGRSSANAVPTVLRRCAGGGISGSSAPRRRVPPVPVCVP